MQIISSDWSWLVPSFSLKTCQSFVQKTVSQGFEFTPFLQWIYTFNKHWRLQNIITDAVSLAFMEWSYFDGSKMATVDIFESEDFVPYYCINRKCSRFITIRIIMWRWWGDRHPDKNIARRKLWLQLCTRTIYTWDRPLSILSITRYKTFLPNSGVHIERSFTSFRNLQTVLCSINDTISTNKFAFSIDCRISCTSISHGVWSDFQNK